MPRKHLLEFASRNVRTLRRGAGVHGRKSKGSLVHRVAGRLGAPGLESLKVGGAPFKVRSVARRSREARWALKSPSDLVVGLERSYKSIEETRERQRRLVEEKAKASKSTLTPNQPMEQTLPRCALQRRSSAR